MKKMIKSALFRPLRQWTGNNFLFQGGLNRAGLIRGVMLTDPMDAPT